MIAGKPALVRLEDEICAPPPSRTVPAGHAGLVTPVSNPAE
jgi:hypothetical protein